jgi:hypothetical protein
MKNLNLKTILAATALLLCGRAMASDFDLASVSADDIRASQAEFRAPAAQAVPAEDDLIGMDMNIRVPFKAIKNAVVQMAATEKRLSIIDRNAPVIFKSGEFLKISNIKIDQGGIIVIPTLTLKPYLEGRDKLAVRIQKIQLHAAMEPDVKAAPMASMNQEDIMAQVMDVMIKGVYSALNAKLQAKKLPLKAEDVVKMNYDKAGWTLRAQVSSKIINQFVPPGLVGELHLTGFTVGDNGVTLKIQTPQ